MSGDQIPEQVYLDAAKAHVEALFSHRPLLSDATLKQSKRLGFRAAVESAYRAGQAAAPGDEDVVTPKSGDHGPVDAGDVAMVVRATGALITSVEVLPESDEAAVPDGPRRWTHHVPAEPGPDVLVVEIAETGQRWERRYAKDQPDRWAWGHWLLEWSQLLSAWAVGRTLTDATPAVGQGGDGHG